MRFASPQILYLLGVLPPLYLLFLVLHVRRRRLARRLGDPRTLDLFCSRPIRGSLLKEGMFVCLALLFLLAALAGPQAGTRLEPVTITGTDLYIALDISRSMGAEDMQGSRLDRARITAAELISSLRGDRAGLILFAADAFVQCPLTTDYAALLMFLDSLDSGTTVSGGTSLSAPLRRAMDSLSPEDDTYAAVLLMTDGENTTGELEKTVREMQKRGIRVFCIGLGTEAGAPIPVYDESGERTGYLKDRQGKVVISSLQENLLRGVAEQTGGYYFRAGRSHDEAEKVRTSLETLKKREIETKKFTVYEERFQIPLGCGILFFFLYVFSLTRSRRAVP
jgi:Ca-activated chloride channel family protein